MIKLENLKRIMRQSENAYWWENIKSLVFPPVCGICGKLNPNYLCGRCNLELLRCAEFQRDNYITEAGFKRKHYDEHIYFFQYQGLIREQLINYKFNDEAYKYKALSNFILKDFILKDINIFQIFNYYDVIIPVPISKKRLKERGYNQAELISREISKKLNKTLITKCLYKIQNIVAQSTLNKEKREDNIKGVFKIKNREKLVNKKVLLVDDIYTTGSTANECCKVLGQAGVIKVGVMTIAKD